MGVFLGCVLLFTSLQNSRPASPGTGEQQDRQAVTEPAEFAAATVEELSRYRAVLETSFGSITIELLPEKAPNHVRSFLQMASAGLYDGTAWHRVVPGLLIQTGLIATRSKPPSEEARRFIHPLEPELNDTPHLAGTVSMDVGDDGSRDPTSFFICTADSTYLDQRYTAFGRVVDGMRVVKAIENLPTDGDKPLTRISLSRVRVERIPQ